MPSIRPKPSVELAAAAVTIGYNLRRLRKQRTLSQLELAHAIGLNGANAGAIICRLEAGAQHPRLSTLYRLAAALHVGIGALTAKRK